MRPFSSKIMSVVLSFALCVGLTAGENSDRRTQKLWREHIEGQPNPRVVEEIDFELIEGMQIIQKRSGLSDLGAALSTVAFEGGGVKIKDCALSAKLFDRLAKQIKGESLTQTEKEALKELAEHAAEEYWERHPGLKGKVAFDKTFGIRDAKFVQMTFGQEDSVMPALKQVARYHGYVPILEKTGQLAFTDWKEAIDKKIPLLLQFGNGRFRVGFGYLSIEEENYVIFADCSEIPLEKRPMHILPSALNSDDPRVKAAVERRKEKRITTDYETGNAKGKLVQGVKIVPYQRIKKSTAYLIYNWRRSAEAWREEIIDIVGEPKEKKDDEEE